MFSKTRTMPSTEDFSEKTERLKYEIQRADAVVVGAGAGLSASAGFAYDGERFERYFSDFHKKYGITDMYSGGFYPFETPEEFFAWWSRHILINRYDCPVGVPYRDLSELLKGMDTFVLTTNVDHQFRRAGFDKHRLFYTQGDYGLWQCSVPCHDRTYDNEDAVRKMVAEQRDMKIPTELIPHCPVCGAPMTVNLRCDDRFVQDEGWYAAAGRYEEFLRRHEGLSILFLEIGVGFGTPAIIKYPFLRMTARNPRATYACINLERALCPEEIAKRAICIQADIGETLARLAHPSGDKA